MSEGWGQDVDPTAGRLEKQYQEDLVEIMRSTVGRRFIWRHLQNMGLFEIDSPNNRAEAVSLWGQIGVYCGDQRKTMLMENMDG